MIPKTRLFSQCAWQHKACLHALGLDARCQNDLAVQDEVEEVEAKLEASEQQPRTKLQRILNRLCTPVFLEALILTFLAGITTAAAPFPSCVPVPACLRHV